MQNLAIIFALVFSMSSHSVSDEIQEKDRSKQVYAEAGKRIQAQWDDAVIDSSSASTVSRAKFVGFVEGSLSVKTPSWWQDMILRDGGPSFSRGNAWIYPVQKDGVNSSENVSVSTEGESIKVTLANKLTVAEPRQRGNNRADIVTALVEPEYAYVVFASHIPSESRLLKLDMDTGKALWRSSVAGGDSPLIAQGRDFHFITVVEDSQKNVVIFGGSSFGMYLEVFSSANGQRLLRVDCARKW